MDLNGVEDKDGLEKPLLPDMLFMVIVNGEIIWFFSKKILICLYIYINYVIFVIIKTNELFFYWN